MLRALLVVLAGCGRLGFDTSSDAVTDALGGDGAGDAAGVTFVDGFDRADSPSLGNGWIEKTPSTFQIEGNAVTRTTSGDWTVNQVYRPASEDQRDIAVSLEFEVLDVAEPDWPQVFVRGNPAAFAGYYVWLEMGPGTADTVIDIARKESAAAWWTGLAQSAAPPAMVGERYRLRLFVRGASPVNIDAWYERSVDVGTWEELVHLTAVDAVPEAITDPGTWGFDGHVGTTGGPYRYDNFTATPM